MSSIKVEGNLKTDKNAIAEVACVQALHLRDILKSRRARGKREETRTWDGREKGELTTITYKFSFPPRETAKRVNCHRKRAAD